MLKSLKIRDVTVFKAAEIDFAPGLNVIAGENGCGKSHVLKLVYSLMAATWQPQKKEPPARGKAFLQTSVSAKLVGVLRPESLGRLSRRRPGRVHSELELRFDEPADDCSISFSTKDEEVSLNKLPERWQPKAPVFFPTRELMTLYPNFVAFYDGHYLEYEETYRDTCVLLGAPVLRGAKSRQTQKLLMEIEEALGGKVTLDRNGHFYLSMAGQGTMEMPLVSEGFRKLAMAVQLINNGSLQDKGYFFWDEPEANLNPKLIKLVARLILGLCKGGIQVFIATHSLFLLRELSILLSTKEYLKVPRRFIGLHREGGETTVETVEAADELTALAMLDEELSQTDRYLAEAA